MRLSTYYEFTYYDRSGRPRRSGCTRLVATPQAVAQQVMALEFPNRPDYAMCEVVWFADGDVRSMVLFNEHVKK